MEDLKNIIKEIKGYRTNDFKPSDDAILDCSTRIFNTGRMHGFERGSKETGEGNATEDEKKQFKIRDPNSPATDAQKKKLKGLGVKIKANLTKGEAHVLIDEKLKEKEKENSSNPDDEDYDY